MLTNILLIIFIVVLLIIAWLLRGLIIVKQNSNSIALDNLNRLYDYKEDEIIAHLNYIINEAEQEYELYNITPKQIYYINSTEEQKMIEAITETVPERLSPVLKAKLSYMYDRNYLGKFLGTYIYSSVTEYVLRFNLDHENKKETK